MNKYKLIIADYGETMVNTGEEIRIENVKAIKKYQEAGGYFSIATGREWSSIRRKIASSKLMQLDEMMIICCYGSLIISSKTNKIIYEVPLSENLVIDSINYLSVSENNIPFSLVSKDNTLIKHNVDVSSYRWKQYNNKILFDNCE